MKKMIKYVSALLLVSTLSACGGGGGGSSTSSNPPVNVAPTLTIDSTVSLDENTEKMITFTATDSDGAPAVDATSSMSSVSVVVNGNQITLKASEVQQTETGTLTVIATDVKDSTKKTTKTVSVTVNNVITVEVVQEGQPVGTSVVAETGSEFSLKTTTGEYLELKSESKSSDPTVAKLILKGKVAELEALKDGTVNVTLVAQVDQSVVQKTFEVKVTGNKMPSMELSQFNFKMVEGTKNTVNVTIFDEDNTANPEGLSVSSSNSSVATATLNKTIGSVSVDINGISVGNSRIEVKLTDTPHTITTYIDVEVTEAGLPTLVLNRNQVLEMSEDERVEFDIEIIGSKSEEYVPTVTLVEQVGELTDLEYSVEGRKLIVKTKMLPPLGNYFNNLYTVKVSATNGTKTITTNDTNLLVFKKMNAVPIFEFSNVFGTSILVNQTGETRITMTINDDNASNITFTQPEAWFNKAVSGTYTIRIEDTVDPEKKTLIINTTGFAKDEKFGSLLGYSDGQLGGKMGLQFRTYNFTNLDQEVIDYAKVITSKVEALKEYVEIAKFYSEVLENEGVLTSLEADNYVDLITTEDVDYSRLETIEYYISMAFEMALIDDFNKDPNLVNTMKFSLDSLFSEVEQQVGKLNIDLINEMASMSKGKLPLLTYENIVNQYEGVYYSKFVGNSTYGSSDTGSWVFKPEYSFLNATKLRVQDNYKARVN